MQQQPRPQQPRSGRDRRDGDRRQRLATVPHERRRGERRSGEERRRSVASARRPPPRDRDQGNRSARDRHQARLLPDAFVESSGDAVDRVSRAVRHAWPRAPLPIRAGLAEAVLPLLEPLLSGASITDALREQCEEAALRALRRRPG